MRREITYDVEWRARLMMEECKRKGIRCSLWHRSVCEYIVTFYL